MECNCRCINCKSPKLEYFGFKAKDGFDDIHHTCKICKTHFNHLDGETYKECKICNFNT